MSRWHSQHYGTALYSNAGHAGQRNTSTRSSRHSILIPGPVWIYCRLGVLDPGDVRKGHEGDAR